MESIRAVRAARRSAVKARAQAANQLKSLPVTAPDCLSDRLRRLTIAGLVEAAARLRPGPRPSDPEEATKLAPRSVARRHQVPSEEVAEFDVHLGRLVAEAAPELLEVHGVETAAALLIAAGDNPERLGSEAYAAPTSAGRRPSRPPRARPSATDSTVRATATPTAPCTSSRSPA